MQNHYNDIATTYKINNNIKEYSFENCLRYLTVTGRQKYGPKFKIYPDDHPVIFKLLIYFIKDENNAKKLQIDLNKGILLTGKIGCGKTSILQLMKPFCCKKDSFQIKTCREITFDFAKKGYETIDQYTQKNNSQSRLPGICFDDLGAEQPIKHFGNDCNVMGEILLSRYESYIAHQSITHCTTNLSASDIEAYYGNRLRSRMRQMFNLISFSNNTTDKR